MGDESRFRLSYEDLVSLTATNILNDNSKKTMMDRYRTMDLSAEQFRQHFKDQTYLEEYSQARKREAEEEAQLSSPAKTQHTALSPQERRIIKQRKQRHLKEAR